MKILHSVCLVSDLKEKQNNNLQKYYSNLTVTVCTFLALRCRMRIWTPFPWLIPQDPQSFPAPHRKPHVLCITIQAYFRAEKQKIERNTELPGLPQSVPQLVMFLWKMRSRSDRTELPRGKHEIFSIVIPLFPSLFSSSKK